ncbi:LysR family transcriptional regulator [Pseudomonadota bacterium]
MDKLLAMTTFVQIVERGSLTAAAEALDKSLPSVVRMLATLEASLDVRLLNRTTRRMTLTDEGRHYLLRCRQILADIEETELELTAQQSEPSGHLNVTAPIMFGKMHVAPVITDFLKNHSRVAIDLLLYDRAVNLIEEGIDVAIRIGHLGDSSMIAKPVGEIRRVVCASPSYLEKVGRPTQPKEISKHNCVRFTGLSPGTAWQFFDNGKSITVQTKVVFGCNQATAAIDACVAGLGIGMFLSYQIEPLVKAGKLKIILPDFEPPPMPVNVVYSHAKLISTRVRVFVEWMAEKLRQDL